MLEIGPELQKLLSMVIVAVVILGGMWINR